MYINKEQKEKKHKKKEKYRPDKRQKTKSIEWDF
jgi:hypothetical protein